MFKGLPIVPDYLSECKHDIERPEALKPNDVKVTDKITFSDQLLPQNTEQFAENPSFFHAVLC